MPSSKPRLTSLPEAAPDESSRKTRVVGESTVLRAPTRTFLAPFRSLVRSGFESHRGQGPIEISDQIVAILDADGESHEIVGDTQCVALRFWNRSMRHNGGMIDQ